MRILILAVLAVFAVPAAPRPAGAQQPGAQQPGAQQPGAQQPAAVPLTRQEVIGILREALRSDPTILGEALRAHPQVLREGIEALREAEQRDRLTAARTAIATHRAALFRNPEDPVRGNPDGAIALVEFFDARCGYCKQLHPVMEELVRRHPDVRVALKDLPVLGPNSLLAARALLAAQRQGKYPALHAALMRLREDPAEPVIQREAERLGLDWPRLRRDMEDPAIRARLTANQRLAEALRVEGTPAVLIGDTLIPGAVDLATLERLVADQRAAQRAAPRGG